MWEVNWPSLMLFLGCETQWLASATLVGVIWHGINYASAVALLGLRSKAEARRHPARRMIGDLRVMELEARPILNARRADE